MSLSCILPAPKVYLLSAVPLSSTASPIANGGLLFSGLLGECNHPLWTAILLREAGAAMHRCRLAFRWTWLDGNRNDCHSTSRMTLSSQTMVRVLRSGLWKRGLVNPLRGGLGDGMGMESSIGLCGHFHRHFADGLGERWKGRVELSLPTIAKNIGSNYV